MNATATLDAARLIRIATLLFAVLAGTLVYFAYQPQADALQGRIDDAQAQLRSDDVAFSEIPRLRFERAELDRRYAHLFAQNPQAVFLRELASTVRRHGVMLATTSVAQPSSDLRPDAPRPALFSQTRVTLELRGTYRTLLAAIGDLSLGSEIVAVDTPSLQRDGNTLAATVPVVIYEPAHANAVPLQRGEGRWR